jgi:cytosine/adenosine deaminase-related metal-dependent hydrolase
MLGEIATSDWRTCEIPPWRPRLMMFHEAIGPTLTRAHAAAVDADAFLRAAPRDGIRPGLSPHAPYTVHTRLLESLVELSQKNRVPVAMHLAETREELELLNLGSGALRDLLESVGAWEESENARLSCVLDYLTALSRAERALVIHGNYLDDDEVAFLADRQDRMAVVYCPRTHAYFEHESYPLAEMLAAGVTMAFGTDSRSSNPDLSLLAEMRFVRDMHPDVAPSKIVELATLGGARALGLADQIGTLEPGKRADIVAVRMPGGANDPIEQILSDNCPVAKTWLAGEHD